MEKNAWVLPSNSSCIYRETSLLNSLSAYCNLKFHIIPLNKLDFASIKTNDLIFYELTWQPRKDICNAFEAFRKHQHKVVVWWTGDVLSCQDLTMCMREFDDMVFCYFLANGLVNYGSQFSMVHNKLVLGFGFVQPNYPQYRLNFDNKQDMFYFNGTLDIWGAREEALKTFKKHSLKTNFYVYPAHWTNHIFKDAKQRNVLESIADNILSKPMFTFEQSLKHLSKYRYSVAPMGSGLTWRLVETFSQGSLLLSNDLECWNLASKYFTDGYNYLSLGTVDQNIKDIIDLVEDKSNYDYLKTIAWNGRQTYLKYFRCTNGVLPYITMAPIINKLQQFTDSKFNLKIF